MRCGFPGSKRMWSLLFHCQSPVSILPHTSSTFRVCCCLPSSPNQIIFPELVTTIDFESGVQSRIASILIGEIADAFDGSVAGIVQSCHTGSFRLLRYFRNDTRVPSGEKHAVATMPFITSRDFPLTASYSTIVRFGPASLIASSRENSNCLPSRLRHKSKPLFTETTRAGALSGL